ALQILKMGGHFRVLPGRRNILWKRVNASVPFSPGRRSALQCGVSRFVAAQHFVTPRTFFCHESQRHQGGLTGVISDTGVLEDAFLSFKT
ncbi:MAG: hypothetical protein OIF54_00775, partial [Cohaesibacter sp.]|nr:hypothetical protein [Cohaesibacter sp.]